MFHDAHLEMRPVTGVDNGKDDVDVDEVAKDQHSSEEQAVREAVVDGRHPGGSVTV